MTAPTGAVSARVPGPAQWPLSGPAPALSVTTRAALGPRPRGGSWVPKMQHFCWAAGEIGLHWWQRGGEGSFVSFFCLYYAKKQQEGYNKREEKYNCSFSVIGSEVDGILKVWHVIRHVEYFISSNGKRVLSAFYFLWYLHNLLPAVTASVCGGNFLSLWWAHAFQFCWNNAFK